MFAMFFFNAIMALLSDIIAELQLGKRASETRKISNPSSRQNLVMMSSNESPSSVQTLGEREGKGRLNVTCDFRCFLNQLRPLSHQN